MLHTTMFQLKMLIHDMYFINNSNSILDLPISFIA